MNIENRALIIQNSFIHHSPLTNMFTSETQIRVRYAETDQMHVVYHGNYAQYFEVVRAESIRQLGLLMVTWKPWEL